MHNFLQLIERLKRINHPFVTEWSKKVTDRKFPFSIFFSQ